MRIRKGKAVATTTRLMALLRMTASNATNLKTPISSGSRNSAPPSPISPPSAPMIAPPPKAAGALREAVVARFRIMALLSFRYSEAQRDGGLGVCKLPRARSCLNGATNDRLTGSGHGDPSARVGSHATIRAPTGSGGFLLVRFRMTISKGGHRSRTCSRPFTKAGNVPFRAFDGHRRISGSVPFCPICLGTILGFLWRRRSCRTGIDAAGKHFNYEARRGVSATLRD